MSRVTEEQVAGDLPSGRIYRTLKAWIVEGRFAKGDRLPSEQDLAKQFNVARHTLRLALSELDKEGLVLSMGRRRGRVVTRSQPAVSTLMSETVIVLTDKPIELNASNSQQQGWPAFIHVSTTEALRRAGIPVLTLQPGQLSEDQLQRLTLDRPRGVIALWDSPIANGQSILRVLSQHGVPAVTYERADADGDSVSSDHEAGAYELTRWLIEQGRRRILRYWGSVSPGAARPEWLARRDAGHVRAMREAKLEVLPPVEFHGGVTSPEFRTRWELSVRLAAGCLLEHMHRAQPADAIMTASDGSVLSVSAACRLLGKSPHRDVAITGYDNYWADCAERKFESAAPAATVDKLNARLGEELVDLLLARLGGKLPPSPQHRIVKPQMIVVGGADSAPSVAP